MSSWPHSPSTPGIGTAPPGGLGAPGEAKHALSSPALAVAGHPAESHRRVVFEYEAAPLTNVKALAARLRGAKPVCWRGRGDLPQSPWATPFRSTWLLSDLWAGVGGLWEVFLSMGGHLYALRLPTSFVTFLRPQAWRFIVNTLQNVAADGCAAGALARNSHGGC